MYDIEITNSIFNIHKRCFFNFLSILDLKETLSESPTQTSRHSTVRQEICFFFLKIFKYNS